MDPVPYVPVTYLEANAASGPSRPAVLDSGRALTVGELLEGVHAAASALSGAQAFVVARAPVTLDDLRAQLKARGVARYRWPELLEEVSERPLAGPGKVDRRRLRELAVQNVASRP